jgi:hypothetical protein
MSMEDGMLSGRGSIAGACCAAVSLLAAMPACSTRVRSFGQDGAGGAATTASAGEGGAATTASAGGDGGGRACEPDDQEACYSGPPGTLNRGACRAGVRTCDAEGTGYGPCEGEVSPAPDRCDTAEDEDCDGEINEGCRYARCADVPSGAPSGVYALDPDGAGPQPELAVYCDLETDGGGWALVYSSVGSEDGETLPFWNIPYADRLGVKGAPAPHQNHYQGALYLVGREYRDEIEDLEGTVKEVMRATAGGIDPETMKLLEPAHVSGDADVFYTQFFSGWSSPDFDGDTYGAGNCAAELENVTQHYASCCTYNLGADLNAPYDDGGWGPHLLESVAARLGLSVDGAGSTRVRRISRWTRW